MTEGEQVGPETGDAQEAQDEYAWQPDLDESHPLWEPTDWTPAQRTTAIRGLLLLALGGGLIAGCLAVWWTASLAATLLAPIGMTLIFWGLTRLNALFWYPYRHGVTTLGERRRKVMIMVGMITLANVVDVGTLALQLVGVGMTAVAVARGSVGWRGFDPFVLAWLMAAPGLVGFLTSFHGLRWVAYAWRPRRDPAAAATALGPPARGFRRLLRWLVMGGAVACGPVLVVTLPPALSDCYLSLAMGSPPDPQLSTLAALFGLGAALCLILALSELTNPERAATPGAA